MILKANIVVIPHEQMEGFIWIPFLWMQDLTHVQVVDL